MKQTHDTIEQARHELYEARFWPEHSLGPQVWSHVDGTKKAIRKIDNDRFMIVDFPREVKFEAQFASVFE